MEVRKEEAGSPRRTAARPFVTKKKALEKKKKKKGEGESA